MEIESEAARILELVAKMEVDINYTNNVGRTPLMQICKFSLNENFSSKFFDAIFQREDLDVGLQDSQGNSALHLLCSFNKKNAVRNVITRFIERGMNPNATNCSSYNVLHSLLDTDTSDCEDLVAVIRLFIDSGIDIHAQTPNGNTALTFLCIHCGNGKLFEAVQLLAVDSKMDVGHKKEYGTNAFHLLCQNVALTDAGQFVEVVKLLIDCGIDVQTTDIRGSSALTELCRLSKITKLFEAVRFLVTDLKLAVNHETEDKENALHCLCLN